jgi:hypothetical protein
MEHFPAVLVATINLVADVLRGPILLSPDPDKIREALLRSTVQQLQLVVHCS